VPARPVSLGHVRARLDRFLARHRLDEDERRDALLVVHELAANAIEHGSAESDEVEIAIALGPRSLLIRIGDPARSRARPARLTPSPTRESGRGMLIVDRLSSWREELRGGRRELTAELPLRRRRP